MLPVNSCFFSEAVLIYLRPVFLQHLHFDKWYLDDVSELAMSSSVRYQVISDGIPPTVLGLQHGWFILKEVDCHKADSASFQKNNHGLPNFLAEKDHFTSKNIFSYLGKSKVKHQIGSSVCHPFFWSETCGGHNIPPASAHFQPTKIMWFLVLHSEKTNSHRENGGTFGMEGP